MRRVTSNSIDPIISLNIRKLSDWYSTTGLFCAYHGVQPHFAIDPKHRYGPSTCCPPHEGSRLLEFLHRLFVTQFRYLASIDFFCTCIQVIDNFLVRFSFNIALQKWYLPEPNCIWQSSESLQRVLPCLSGWPFNNPFDGPFDHGLDFRCQVTVSCDNIIAFSVDNFPVVPASRHRIEGLVYGYRSCFLQPVLCTLYLTCEHI